MKRVKKIIVKSDILNLEITIKAHKDNAWKDDFQRTLNSVIDNITLGLQKDYHFSEIKLL
jgi:hypothetical protein